MSKRRHEKLEEMSKRLKLMQESLESLQESDDDSGEENASEDGDEEDGRQIGLEDLVVTEDKENVKPEDNNAEDKTLSEEKNEKDLDLAVLEVLGEDPSASKALDFDLHTSLANRWTHFLAHGIPKEEKEKLLEKYARKEGFEAPELNQEILAVLNESGQKRDGFLSEVQRLAGSTLMSLGVAISSLLDEDESIDKLTFLENLNDAAKLVTEIYFKQNESRKAFILPGVSKPVKELLEKTKSDTFLFGKGLSEKIKEFKALERIGPKSAYVQKGGNRYQAPSGSLSFRGPQGRRLF